MNGILMFGEGGKSACVIKLVNETIEPDDMFKVRREEFDRMTKVFPRRT